MEDNIEEVEREDTSVIKARMFNKDTFLTKDSEGNEIRYNIIMSFDLRDTGKSYLVYTDKSENEDGSVNVYASSYDPEADEMKLFPIETDEEKAYVDVLIDLIRGKLKYE